MLFLCLSTVEEQQNHCVISYFQIPDFVAVLIFPLSKNLILVVLVFSDEMRGTGVKVIGRYITFHILIYICLYFILYILYPDILILYCELYFASICSRVFRGDKMHRSVSEWEIYDTSALSFTCPQRVIYWIIEYIHFMVDYWYIFMRVTYWIFLIYLVE